jgi:hypothetical protein
MATTPRPLQPPYQQICAAEGTLEGDVTFREPVYLQAVGANASLKVQQPGYSDLTPLVWRNGVREAALVKKLFASGSTLNDAQIIAHGWGDKPLFTPKPASAPSLTAGDEEVVLTWAAVPGVNLDDASKPNQGYYIEQAPDDTGSPGAWTRLNPTAPVKALTYTATGLTNDDPYHFRIVPLGEAGEGLAKRQRRRHANGSLKHHV